MRWLLFVVVLLLALGSSIATIIHGASFSPVLSIPFLMLAWLMYLLFPAKYPPSGTSIMRVFWLVQAITRKTSDGRRGGPPTDATSANDDTPPLPPR